MTGALRSLGGLTRLAALFLLTGILAATALARGLPETEGEPTDDPNGGVSGNQLACPPTSRCPSTISCSRQKLEQPFCCPVPGTDVKECQCHFEGEQPDGCIDP